MEQAASKSHRLVDQHALMQALAAGCLSQAGSLGGGRTLMPAVMSWLMAWGTPSCSLSSMAVTPTSSRSRSAWQHKSAVSITCFSMWYTGL